jgi:orotidine 5'-phosphate decarboxylase subfamily 1
VKAQYAKGIYRIGEWANLVTVHSIPGNGILKGLKEAMMELKNDLHLNKDIGVFLLVEMSSEDNLITEEYTAKSVKMANDYRDMVTGFICQKRIKNVNNGDNYVYMTPGVNLASESDHLGQHYRDPRHVILKEHSDVIIVGRGILNSDNPLKTVQQYHQIAWEAYEQRCSNQS